MILLTMTAEEITTSLQRDKAWIEKVATRKVYHEWKRQLKKQTRFPMAKCFDRICPDNQQHYVIACRFSSYKDTMNGYWYCRAMAVVRDQNGRLYGVMQPVSTLPPIIYTPHFFDRYAERHLERDIRTLDDRLSVMAQYATWNTEGPNLNDAIHVHQVCKERAVYEGMEMLHPQDNGTYLARTYITGDMLGGRQRSEYEDSVCQLMELNECMNNGSVMAETMKWYEYDRRPQSRTFGNLSIPMPTAIDHTPSVLLPAAQSVLSKLSAEDKKRKQK